MNDWLWCTYFTVRASITSFARTFVAVHFVEAHPTMFAWVRITLIDIYKTEKGKRWKRILILMTGR